jgi:hypothetical protein
VSSVGGGGVSGLRIGFGRAVLASGAGAGAGLGAAEEEETCTLLCATLCKSEFIDSKSISRDDSAESSSAIVRRFEIRPVLRFPFGAFSVELIAPDHVNGDSEDSDDPEPKLNDASSNAVRVRSRPGPGFVTSGTSFEMTREGPGSALRISSTGSTVIVVEHGQH